MIDSAVVYTPYLYSPRIYNNTGVVKKAKKYSNPLNTIEAIAFLFIILFCLALSSFALTFTPSLCQNIRICIQILHIEKEAVPMTTPICNKHIKLYNTTVKKATYLSFQKTSTIEILVSHSYLFTTLTLLHVPYF